MQVCSCISVYVRVWDSVCVYGNTEDRLVYVCMVTLEDKQMYVCLVTLEDEY